LHLHDCHLAAQQISELMQHHSQLIELNVSSNRLGSKGANAVAETLLLRNCRLETLNLGYNAVGHEGALFLVEALQDPSCTLTTLWLGGNELYPVSMAHVLQALVTNTSTRLETLTLEWNSEDEDSLPFSKPLPKIEEGKNTCLKVLDLSGNVMGSKGMGLLAPILASFQHLVELSLTSSDFGEAPLLQVLPQQAFLTKLNLEHNHLEDKGATQVAQLLVAVDNVPHLEKLNLSGNEIGPEGARVLANALAANQVLKRLNLFHNRVGSDIFFAMALATNSTLVELNLAWNCINHITDLVQVLQSHQNTTLVQLDLSGNHLTAQVINQIQSLCERNQRYYDWNQQLRQHPPPSVTLMPAILASKFVVRLDTKYHLMRRDPALLASFRC
jgi:Ran GTPase-activating protein (RanGAP) involved in mRNA processing and transport